MNDNDIALIKNYLAGGASLGAGAGLAVALLNQLKELKRDADEQNEAEKDTMTIKLPASPKIASSDDASWLRAPLAGVGAVLAGGLSFAGIRALHQAIKKRMLQKELEEAQNVFLQQAGEENSAKQASAGRKGMDTSEALSALPISAAMLVGLASAAVANQTLNKTFPSRKPAGRMGPKRVVIERDADNDNQPEELTVIPLEKEAASRELMFDILASSPLPQSDIRDAIYAAANGKLIDMRKVAKYRTVESMLDQVSGASNFAANPVQLKLASTCLAADPLIGPVMGVVAAAEVFDVLDTYTKLAVHLPKMHADAVIDAALIMQASNTEHSIIPVIKSARVTGNTALELLESILDDMTVNAAAA